MYSYRLVQPHVHMYTHAHKRTCIAHICTCAFAIVDHVRDTGKNVPARSGIAWDWSLERLRSKPYYFLIWLYRAADGLDATRGSCRIEGTKLVKHCASSRHIACFITSGFP
jgi:hypothetical protein